jgi:hypothetical protein
LFIPEAVEGQLQTLDETRLLLTLGHVAPPLCACVQFLMAAVDGERMDTAKDW